MILTLFHWIRQDPTVEVTLSHHLFLVYDDGRTLLRETDCGGLADPEDALGVGVAPDDCYNCSVKSVLA